MTFVGESQTKHFTGKKTEHKGGACYLENKSIMHKSPVIVSRNSCPVTFCISIAFSFSWDGCNT